MTDKTIDLEQVREKLREKVDSAPRYQPSGKLSRLTDSASIQAMQFEPIKYVIQGYVPEGLTLLAGRPKLGKSWMALDWALAVAWGGTAMNSVSVEGGDVLYCALEDNLRRIQARLQRIVPSEYLQWPNNLDFTTELEGLEDGGIEFLREWINTRDNPRMIILDTFQKVRPKASGKQSAYDEDYDATKALHRLASETGVAIVAVHHVRKLAADDPVETVSGSFGLTGGVDTILVLDRKSGDNCTLYGRGRDVEEIEQALSFSKETCKWSILGDAGDIQRSTQRSTILSVIADSPHAIGPTEIAAAADMTSGSVRKLLYHMAKDGEIEKVSYGRYRLPAEDGGNTGNTGNTSPNHSENCGSAAGESVTGGEQEGNTNQDGVTEFEAAVTRWDRQNPPETADQSQTVTSVTGVTEGERSNTAADDQTDIEDATEPFGAWADRQRKATELSVTELARRAGVGRTTVNNILKGRYAAGPEARTKLKATLEGLRDAD